MMQRRLRPPGRGMELVRYVVTVGNSLPSAAVAGATRRALARTRSQRGRMRRGPEAVCPMMAVTDGYNVLEWAGGVAGELGFEGDGVACGRKGGGHMVGELCGWVGGMCVYVHTYVHKHTHTHQVCAGVNTSTYIRTYVRTDRQTDRQTHTRTGTHPEHHREQQRSGRGACIHTRMNKYIHADMHAYRQTDRHTQTHTLSIAESSSVVGAELAFIHA